MFPVIRWGNLQSPANWLDPVQVTVLIDISVYYFRRPSSSAWAKKALAVFKISLARRNSLTSRSRSLMRFCSSLVTPGRKPASISARLTQRSEERRVGKECGTGRWTYDEGQRDARK